MRGGRASRTGERRRAWWGGSTKKKLYFLSTSQRGYMLTARNNVEAAIAQLGERQTEDLKVPGSIPGLGM